jgi:hypothetical protein
MALSDEKPAAAMVEYHKCPKCGKKYDWRQRHCECHTRLDMDHTYWTKDADAVIGCMNVDFPDFNCADCGAGCKSCYSFSCHKANHRGFGGTNCVQKQSSLRCSCCQAIMKNAFFDGRNIRELVEGVNAMWMRREAQ